MDSEFKVLGCKLRIRGKSGPPRRFCDVAGLADFFVADDSDELVFAHFGLAGDGGGVVVLHGEFHALSGEQAHGGFSFATPIA